jgi:hypothetical protein
MRISLVFLTLALATACGGGVKQLPSSSTAARTAPDVTVQPSDTPTASAGRPTPPKNSNVDPGAARATVRLLAGLGPRESTSRAYARAAEIVAGRLQALGYDVRRQRFRVPGGAMWGVRVPAGTTVNVVAEPAGFDAAKPHLVIGAHLDTVPRSPGANDNASGVAAMLELARLAAATPPRVPVVFVAFGGEEPRRRSGDSHFGSKAYVAAMDRRARSALEGMISVDAVGVGKVVPVCTAGGSEALQRNVIRTAQKARVPTRRCTNRASDHLSFARAGLQAVLLGGASYREYHAPSDRPAIVDTAALIRTVRLTWSFIR